MDHIPGYRLDQAKTTVRRLRRYLNGKSVIGEREKWDLEALDDIEWLLDNEIAKRKVDGSGYTTA